MGLVVDEIIDIVEQRLDIEVASERPGVLGYAVVKGSATEIIDIGHYLPQAFADWFLPRETPVGAARAQGAAGRRFGVLPRHARAADQGRRLSGRRLRIGGAGARGASRAARGSISSLPISKCRTWTVSSWRRALRENPGTAAIPVIALSAMVSAETVERGRGAGFHDFVAKFDRAGLIAAIKEQSADLASGGVTAEPCTIKPISPNSSPSPSPVSCSGCRSRGSRTSSSRRASPACRSPEPEMAGVLNLRGRIVTVIDMRRRLDVRHREEGDAPMAIGIEAKGESFGLLVDAVGEVLKLPVTEREAESDQSRPQARRTIRRRLPARWPAPCRARHRPGAGPARRRGGGVSGRALMLGKGRDEATKRVSPAKREARTQ